MIEDITERYKCRIHTFAADVGDESEVEKLLERIRAELPPLAGVAHLAGVLDDALLSNAGPGPVPDHVGAQGVRCVLPGPS